MNRIQNTTGTVALPGGGQAHWQWLDETRLAVSLPYTGAFGMGERFDAVNQKGRVCLNKVVEKFCHQGSNTYCPAPFFFTDTGFGLYVETDEVTSFDFTGERITIGLPKGAPVYCATGTPQQMIAAYMALFGPAKLPPKWAFGPWISANHWNTQAQVERQVEDLKTHGYPATVLVVEAWSDEATFYVFNGAEYRPAENGKALGYEAYDFSQSAYWPNPKAMVEMLHQNGLHLVLWQVPVYKQQGPGEELNRQNALDREDAVKRGLAVKMEDGTPYIIPEGHWFSGSMIPDFTNPATVESWFAKRQYLLDIGVDGFKTDGGEFVYRPDAMFANGTTGRQGGNRYAKDYTTAYSKFLGKDCVLFSRAGWAGQHTVPCHWGGDQQSTNDELASVLKAGLSAALTGIPFWGFDIAGFAGPLPEVDLYRRATMLACFCPIMQWHSEPDGGQFKELMPGGEGNNERSPWNLAAAWNQPDLIEELRFWHLLRMNLLPYLYSAALDSVENSRPMMRPLVCTWPGDVKAIDNWDEFLLGDSLLVAPLLENGQTRRDVYLPEGNWTALFTGTAYRGGQIVSPEGREPFPVFLRGGCGIALNTDETRKMGAPVGNRVDGYTHLHFVLGGETGTYVFADDLGNAGTLRWANGSLHVDGALNVPYTWQILGVEG